MLHKRRYATECLHVFSRLQVPAPQRGEIVRQIGQALRDKIDLLGKMVHFHVSAFSYLYDL